MKHLKHLFTALLLLCATTAFAHGFEVDGIYYNVTNATNKTVEVTYKGTSSTQYSNEYTGSVVIPSSVTYNGTTYSVTTIGNYAFYDCSGLTSVTIPNSVTSIGEYAFNGCSGLTSVTIPDIVTSIGDGAFRFCSGLTSVTIPNSVTSIEKWAFYDCSGLTSVTIGNGVTSIGGSAFSNCSGLTSVHISDLSAWCNIEFGGASANPLFYAKKLYLNGELLTNLVIPDGVTKIKNYAFYNCSGLASITIPNSVTSIGGSAFVGCTGLTSITIPNSVTSIGSDAFYGCGLTSVHISDLSAWCNIEFGGASANPLYHAKNLYLNGELLTNLIIPNGVTKIKNYAFRDCSGLASITIPNSVTSIGYDAFADCDGIMDFLAAEPAVLATGVFGGNAVLVVPDAAVATYKEQWSNYASQIVGKSDAVVSVDVEAMEATSGIMEKIGLDKMASVAKLTVKGSINSYDVIQFRDKMPILRELDLSEATVVASDKAFYNGNCTKDNDLGAYAFCNLAKLCSVKLPKGLLAIGECLFYKCSSLCEVEMPETVQSIGGSAFYGNSALRSIIIPAGVQSIGGSAFYGNSALRSIIIPAGVQSIGSSAFYGNSALKSIIISAGVKEINDYTFYRCSGLENIVLPDGLESIVDYAFKDCSSLKEIKLPPTVKSIGNSAFNGCSSLEEIRIPSSVTSIGGSAFGNCSKLNKVYTYTVEPTTITESTFITFATATLYVPSFSFSNYYWDDGWKRFLNLEEFNEPYEYFYVNNDYTLNDDTGYIEGADGNAPDADINAGGGIIIEGEQSDEEEPNQNLGDVNVGCDGNGTSGSIIGDNNLHIDDLHIKINVKGGRWYFFAFPFDIKLDRISMENGSDYVFRYYDGEERAKNGRGGWKDINENHLKAARGYIFQCSADDVLVLSIEDVKFKKEDKYNELVAHVSENMKDASWNFTGNPYLSYYDMANMDYTAPVTVWDGSKYIAIRPGDDDYHFAPYEAFFVQKPEGKDAVGFDGEEQMTKKQSEKKKEKQSAARRAREVNPERLLVNIILDNGASNDRARIVFNDKLSLGYETACDAAKFETAGVVQIYTIDNENVRYAINERPADNGKVLLGYSVPAGGAFTISVGRMDVPVVLVDTKDGSVHDFANGGYTFSSNAGTFDNRFEIQLKGAMPGTTGIDEVKGEGVETIYDLHGRKVKDANRGIYIINGEKVLR